MVIQFRPRNKTNRVEALVKGQIERYSCDTCGNEFEVVFGNRPDKCPSCGLKINWRNCDDDWSE